MPARGRRYPMQVRCHAARARRLWRPAGPGPVGIRGDDLHSPGLQAARPGPPAVDAAAALAHVNAHRRASAAVAAVRAGVSYSITVYSTSNDSPGPSEITVRAARYLRYVDFAMLPFLTHFRIGLRSRDGGFRLGAAWTITRLGAHSRPPVSLGRTKTKAGNAEARSPDRSRRALPTNVVPLGVRHGVPPSRNLYRRREVGGRSCMSRASIK
jgi:hypothetical protein